MGEARGEVGRRQQVCLRLKDDDSKFEVSLDTHQYRPDELKVNVENNLLTVDAKHSCVRTPAFSLHGVGCCLVCSVRTSPRSSTSFPAKTTRLSASFRASTHYRPAAWLTRSPPTSPQMGSS